MEIALKEPSDAEIILLHDSYFESPEPDAPKKLFANLTNEEKLKALKHYSKENHRTIYLKNKVIGFVGLYPDEKIESINVFAVIIHEHRGKGYSSLILNPLIAHCQMQHPQYKQIRTLTRRSNVAAIKGLNSLSFKHVGAQIEEYSESPDGDVKYEEYILLL